MNLIIPVQSWSGRSTEQDYKLQLHILSTVYCMKSFPLILNNRPITGPIKGNPNNRGDV